MPKLTKNIRIFEQSYGDEKSNQRKFTKLGHFFTTKIVNWIPSITIGQCKRKKKHTKSDMYSILLYWETINLKRKHQCKWTLMGAKWARKNRYMRKMRFSLISSSSLIFVIAAKAVRMRKFACIPLRIVYLSIETLHSIQKSRPHMLDTLTLLFDRAAHT